MSKTRLLAGTENVQTPLFGEQQPRERITNIVISVVAVLVVISTLLSALLCPTPPCLLNIAFAVVVLMVCAGNVMLVYWYRQGDVDPKFRRLIYFNAVTIILLSVCADVYIFRNGCDKACL